MNNCLILHDAKIKDMVKIKSIKRGWYVNHPKYGNLSYRGLITKSPYSDTPKVPHQYLFWQSTDENGNERPDIIELDGNIDVEVTDRT